MASQVRSDISNPQSEPLHLAVNEHRGALPQRRGLYVRQSVVGAGLIGSRLRPPVMSSPDGTSQDIDQRRRRRCRHRSPSL